MFIIVDFNEHKVRCLPTGCDKMYMKSKGFTLIELIITIVILGIIGVFTFQFITSGVESYVTLSAGEDVAREARLALERMSREVRGATNIVGSLSSAITFDRTQGVSTDSSTQVTFWRDGNTLRRYRGINPQVGQGEPLASNVSSFTVTRSSGNGEMITLDLTLSGQTVVQQRTLVYPRYFKYQ